MRSLRLLAGVCLLAACSSKVPRDNPYDPDGTGLKKPGRIAGQVFIAGGAPQDGHAIYIYDDVGARADGSSVTTDTDGRFLSSGLEPGTYRLEVEVPPDNFPAGADDVVVLPGVTVDVGLLASLVQPP